MFGAIAGGIASALAGGAMSKLFGGGQKAASGGIQGDGLATDNNTVGMGDAGIKSAIQGSNVPNPDEAVPSFVSGAMAKAGKGLLEGTTLSQSPMLGFHKQMDNRIKLLEEILSFRMQGVEFDNGDMYVDGHK